MRGPGFRNEFWRFLTHDIIIMCRIVMILEVASDKSSRVEQNGGIFDEWNRCVL